MNKESQQTDTQQPDIQQTDIQRRDDRQFQADMKQLIHESENTRLAFMKKQRFRGFLCCSNPQINNNGALTEVLSSVNYNFS